MAPDRHQHPAPATVSVVGASGFIGRRLTESLTLSGVRPNGFTRAEPFHHEGTLVDAVRRAEVVFFLAGSITPAVAERAPAQADDDRRCLRVLLNGLRRAPHRPLVVLASSGGTVYDPKHMPPFTEESPTRATAGYGAAKLYQEQDLVAACEWIAPVVLRLANVYGPGQHTAHGYGVVGHWMESVAAGAPVTVLGESASRRDYVHVDDVCAALLAVHRHAGVLRARRVPTVLNIGSGVPTSLEELLDLFGDTVSGDLEVHRRRARTFDRHDVWLNVGRAARLIGWRPRITLSDGLADTWRAHQASYSHSGV